LIKTISLKGFQKVVIFLVVQPVYEIDVFKENVMVGNDALFKCQIPSFVSDLVTVESWTDSEGIEIRMNSVLGKLEQILIDFHCCYKKARCHFRSKIASTPLILHRTKKHISVHQYLIPISNRNIYLLYLCYNQYSERI
jgi:hypothetical protein